jgi:copper chaperone CopZ
MKAIAFFFAAILGLGSIPKPEATGNVITESFTVYGNCGMCKNRIETALKVKGVKRATWNTETHIATVTFDSTKVTLDQLHQAVANVGHDTDKVRAKDEVYQKLHSCCQYERKS